MQPRYVVLVNRDIRVGVKLLSAVQLIKDVSYGKDINLIERNAIKTLKMLDARQTNMNLVKSSMELPPMRKVGYASNFGRKLVMQTGQSKRINAMSEVHFKHLSSVLHFGLPLSLQKHRGSFLVLKRVSRGLTNQN